MNYNYLTILVLVSMSILFISLALLALYGIRYMRNKIESLDYINTVNTKVDLDCIEILDGLIKDIFDEYILLNVSLASDEILYINSELETRIYKEVSNNVIDTISITLLQKLNTIYNMEAIPDVISKKVYFMTTEYVIDHNRVLQNNE